MNFDIMRNLKESLLITQLGAEILPFVKFWVVVPGAVIFLLLYSYLSNRLNQRWLFVVTLLPFLAWMPLFSHVLYPNLDALALNSLALYISNWLPESLLFVSGLILYWPLTLFYVMAELWGAGVMCILLWTLLNNSYSEQTATDAYPLITVTSNGASLFSGPLMIFCIHLFSGDDNGWQNSMSVMSDLFLIFGGIMLLLHELCCRQGSPENGVKKTESATATRLSFLQSVSHLGKSPYLILIAVVMFSYCVAINLIEVTWKSQLVRQYPDASDFSLVMGQLTFFIGGGCLTCGFLNYKLLHRSWFSAAIAVPIIMAVTATPFFILTLLDNHCPECHELLLTGIVIGGISNSLSKAAKYTIFDTTKELAFIPLDNEQKLKGKAAIELVVSRLGKSGGAVLQQFLILTLGSLSGAIPYLTVVFILILSLWFLAIKNLNNHYLLLKKTNDN